MAEGVEVYLAAACPDERCLVLLAADPELCAWCFMKTYRAGDLSTEAAWGSSGIGLEVWCVFWCISHCFCNRLAPDLEWPGCLPPPLLV